MRVKVNRLQLLAILESYDKGGNHQRREDAVELLNLSKDEEVSLTLEDYQSLFKF